MKLDIPSMCPDGNRDRSERRRTPVIAATVFALGVCSSMIIFAPPAAAETGLVVELQAQLAEQTEALKNGVSLLKRKSSYRKEADEAAKKARSVPVGSKDFSYYRSRYLEAAAKDLSERTGVAHTAYRNASGMLVTLDQLINAQKSALGTGEGNSANFNTQKEMRETFRQWEGLNQMIMNLSASDYGGVVLEKAQQAYRVKLENMRRAQQLHKNSGIEHLRMQRDVIESLTYLLDAFGEALKNQHDELQVIGVNGQANIVINDTEAVTNELFDVLIADDGMRENNDYFLGTMDTEITKGGRSGTGLSSNASVIKALRKSAESNMR